MPARRRAPSEVTLQTVPLVLIGIGLVTSNPSATILENEARTLSRATQPVHVLLSQFFSPNSPGVSRPPLFEILLHFWLRWTGGPIAYLRVPSILLFMAGVFLLGRAARELLGKKGGIAVIWAAALWPFGFHYGRLAIAPLFSFFLTCGLTFSYLKFLERRSFGRWAALLVFGLALTWTSYLGSAVIACLSIDLAMELSRRSREAQAPETKKDTKKDAKFELGPAVLIGSLLLLLVVPFAMAVRRSFPSTPIPHQGFRVILANAAYGIYSLFVSESVEPWHWQLSVPAGIAVLGCVLLAVWWTSMAARRFLLYGAILIALMALLGTLNSSRLLELSPWILLPIGVAIEAEKPQWANLAFAVTLLAVAGIGWYGIYARRFYSEPRFLEPWENVAGQAAEKVRGGATLIADEPSLLFYLTYFLHVPNENGPWQYRGSVTEFVQHPQVFTPEQWLSNRSDGHTGQTTLVIRNGDQPGLDPAMDEAAKQFDQTCGSIMSRLMVRDPGQTWKQRYLGRKHEPVWRIEVREYDCRPGTSK